MIDLPDPPIRYSASSPIEGPDGETRTSDTVVFNTANFSGPMQRDMIASLIGRLKTQELRDLAIDVLDTALVAYRELDYERLRESIVSWLASADMTGSTRRQARAIREAREEGRALFGTPPRGVSQERRKVFHMFRPKRGWVPEWLWRIVKHVALWEPFTTLFTEPPDEADWGR